MNDLRKYFLLYIGIFVYSLSALMNKAASAYPVISFHFIFFYGLSLAALALYAFLWQQVLKRFPLTTAYSNRPIATALGMLWGALFFQESITGNMVLGTILIIIGIRIVVKADDA